MLTATDVISAARQAATQGDAKEAGRLFSEGLQLHPDDPSLNAHAASFALSQQNFEEAIKLYRHAVELSPHTTDWILDLAIALTSAGNFRAAVDQLQLVEDACASMPRYWSIRANAERQSGDIEEAATSYDRCLTLQPDHPRALHGRARVALVRAEEDAPAFFERALAVVPSDADLWLGKAQALDAAGRLQEARDLTAQLLTQAPHWVDALNLMAQLKAATGEAQIDAHFYEAARRQPGAAAIPVAHIRHLAVREEYAEAALVAAEAARRFPEEEFFALSHASNAGMAGDLDQADALFSQLSRKTPERALQEGRHRLRRGDLVEAERLLLDAASHATLSQSALALLYFVWRLKEDSRADWLHGQDGLVQLVALPDTTAFLDDVVHTLERIHDQSSFPVGQSLRGGTQTRHILFQRKEKDLHKLKRSIQGALEIYRRKLPEADLAHPLLRHRNTDWSLAGSWSVRLGGGGDHHASHIHPQGVLSSALYLVLPETADGAGHLELGRPPPDLRLDLGPAMTIEPKIGHLALFPSTLFHGTTPFGGKSRMTVAFDVVPTID